jgi:hypothetical protein
VSAAPKPLLSAGTCPQCTADNGRVCPCDDPSTCPWPIWNPRGLPEIAYRAGDFASFRRAMLHALPGESELAGWRPTASTDLAQVVDWWAYIADVLAFYTERIANEAYLGTATLPESVSRLVSVLGYRPRPGIGATATLGVLAAGPGPITLPAGFAVMSKAAPGVDPQTFELGRPAGFAEPASVPAPPSDSHVPPAAGPPDAAPAGTADPPPRLQLIVRGGVLVKGRPTSVKVGDRLLLIVGTWASADDQAAVVTVTGLVPEKDAHRRTNTRILITGADGLGAAARAADFRLQRPTAANHLVTVPTDCTPVTKNGLVLDSTARFLKAGNPLLVELPGAGTGTKSGSGFDIVHLDKYREVVWFADGDKSDPTKPPTPPKGIPLLVADLEVTVSGGGDLGAAYGGRVAEATVRSGWTDVGTLLDTPVDQVDGVPSAVQLARPPRATPGKAVPALVEDANGTGSAVTATPQPGGATVALSGASDSGFLQPPLRLLWDLITVTRGASVRDESLGLGDAAQAGQDFVLQKKPVTYLADEAGGTAAPGPTGLAGAGSRSGDGYSSTVDLVVDGVHWREVPSFYGTGPGDAVFVTREDEQSRTHVLTGDGVNGLRLATGAVVTASYRIGGGAAVPPRGHLTQILTPVDNLSSLRDPAGAGGGADPDPPERLRALAPASVLTFGRAVSAEDYAVIAAQAPGVIRAAAQWAWDPGQQRAMTAVYVGDDDAAVASARAALRAAADPNRPVTVLPAVPVRTRLRLTLRLDPAYVTDLVLAAVRSELLDPPAGLFAPGVLALGEVLYRSRIEAACDLPGVLAVRHLRMRWHGYRPGTVPRDARGPRYVPGAGGWFDVPAERLHISAEVAEDA